MSSHPKFQPVSGELYGEALDRIAELEAKVAEQANLAAEQYDRGVQEGNKQAEAELAALKEQPKDALHEELAMQVRELRAELEALEAKTCETCAKWGENICPHSSDLFLCETWKQYTTRDVFCSFWAERGGE
jgi:uncharacterized coiled-coil protein SlyX